MDTTVTTALLPGRPPPPPVRGWSNWCRQHLFADTPSTLVTLFLFAAILSVLPGLVDWAVLNAVFVRDAAACRAAAPQGACWGVIAEKFRPILFGRYPHAEQWRAALAALLLIAALVVTCRYIDRQRLVRWSWLSTLLLVFALLHGGWGGLPPVASALWGGLPLTLLLTIGTVGAAFPLAVLLALGRRSRLPTIRSACAFFVELARAVPLVSVLLLAAFLVPLFLPQGMDIDVLLRVWIGLTLFAAAYMAEVLRAGLQSVARGQVEAASALGLRYWSIQRHVVLPQVIRATLPALMNSLISIFKETSLVTVVGLYELTGALTLTLAGDLEWREFYLECYLFTATIYWLGCFSLSRYSQRLAKRQAL